jgi:hypothetical protein
MFFPLQRLENQVSLFLKEVLMRRIILLLLMVVFCFAIVPLANAQCFSTFNSYSTVVTAPVYCQPAPVYCPPPVVVCPPPMRWNPGYCVQEERFYYVDVQRGGHYVETPGPSCAVHGTQGPTTRIWCPGECVREKRSYWVNVWHDGFWSY